MANPAAVIGLTYRGTDLQDATIGIFLEIVRGLNDVVQVRGEDQIVPTASGRVVRNRLGDRHVIELRGWVAGTGSDEAAQRASFRGHVNTLRALFDPTLDPGALVADLEDGSVMTIDARSLNLVWDQLVPALHRLSVELESVDPDWVIGS